jgi:hypothetical protein
MRRSSSSASRHVSLLVALVVAACAHAAPATLANLGGPRPIVLAPVDGDPAAEARRLASVTALVPAGATCLPPVDHPLFRHLDGRATMPAPSLALALVGDTPVLCAIDAADDRRALGPLACWAVDARTGARAYVRPGALPGVSFGYTSAAPCCANDMDTSGALVMAWSTNGRWIAVTDAYHVAILDAKTRRRTQTIDLGEAGVTEELVRLAFVGDELFVEGRAGERHVVREIGLDAAGQDRFAHDGTVGALDAHHAAVATYGLRSLVAIDAETGARTDRTRVVSNPDCFPDPASPDVDRAVEEASPACQGVLQGELAPFAATAPIELPDGELMAVLHRGERAELAVLDGETLRLARTFPISCE